MAILADWCQKIEGALSAGGDVEKVLARAVEQLSFMAGKVITNISNDVRQKLAQMITEVVHQRDVSRQLIQDKVSSPKDFQWLQLMRMYWNPSEPQILQRLSICMADASFFYGFEYLGIADKLVQTPLTDRCFLTLTQALHMRLGANPFGPAGTGKTESVKALGNTMGRFVLVFCCDEGFDFQAMGRIFVGLCQVGAWGCFDEFNRLEERILSAVSEQVLTIQTGNKQNKKEIEILGKQAGASGSLAVAELRGIGCLLPRVPSAGALELQRGHLRNHESRLRRALQPARQPEAALPGHGDAPSSLCTSQRV